LRLMFMRGIMQNWRNPSPHSQMEKAHDKADQLLW
jgi:hypothetical protein